MSKRPTITRVLARTVKPEPVAVIEEPKPAESSSSDESTSPTMASDAGASMGSESTYTWKQACKDAGVSQWKAKKASGKTPATEEYNKAMDKFIAGKIQEDKANGVIRAPKSPTTESHRELWSQCCTEAGVKYPRRDTPAYDKVMALYVEKKEFLDAMQSLDSMSKSR